MENLTNINVIKSILEKHGFSFSKGLGQNFLINPDICPKIAEMGNAAPGNGILEIGTGFGTLTAELAKRADKVVAIEIDTRLLPILDETLCDFNNVKIINDDVMKCDIKKIITDEFAGMDVSVCANLPYYITSPIIMMLLENNLPIKSITVMVQKEAAQRLCAKVGSRESGAITVAVNYYADVKKLFSVSRGSFMPAPNVDSAVIRIDLKDTGKLDKETEDAFFKIVKYAFAQRRKTLLNSLSAKMNIDKDKLVTILESININPSVRVEQLDINQLKSLAVSLKAVI
ncbi:MAG: 16S rRNA (adenine(1518)-N(6)/adenine(1519)-N(6))-dimethyltransferase RsmA [Ruminococcus sp.]|jgi:16S rRNA (adenine1518-N6/adenine1519-N6)-dimethyltransferase|nr:16S rRNA (adenine(1518)-N(6)/adenine(1519)-N(6))-dimethyltransferase RsmA [Ruminococcus sp.]